ncbi:sensor histidine kinase [Spirosoma utsteinense]|uniref:histidine kinase n=1 Tax=Spirosoma utsteinense TaxID=2585773 RepID=A0ABR6WB40_9BACT|nr:HAMP domain-containing sensor histidine kinase [Spirosoma utsteinense]MBC3786818.1 signal transduction histidine kinase [Spirosoma utsteinense]MBC3793761.1 signal transduction histidine kinase [Spirosoma utsteinense]
MLKSFDIYSQNNILKIIVALNLLLVGTGSLLYTNRLINKLELREEQYIQLYAKSIAYLTDTTHSNSGDLNFVTSEILQANQTIPAIYVNPDGEISMPLNFTLSATMTDEEKQQYLREKRDEMRKNHMPVVVEIGNGVRGLVYYNNSGSLRQLNYFPYALLAILTSLGVLAYLAFSSSRRAEQNRVWVGLAKETAHQLGTPMSSLMAWVEYMRSDPEQFDGSITDEIEKDVQRLETITARFSSIGSVPTLKDEDLNDVVQQFTGYLARRISTKVKMSVASQLPAGQTVKMNKLLFEWVIENICKNAVDAMKGVGELRLNMIMLPHQEVAIDITDTGKGISKANMQKVFNPGYSTKKRGWGLGLTLAKRIVEEYHDGRLYVKSSDVGKGTTFRIVLNTD